MPTWVLSLITLFLLFCFWNGIKGSVIEWPAMPLRKKVVSVFAALIWAAITVRVAVVLFQRLI